MSGFTPTRGPIRDTAAFIDNPGSCSRASATNRCARSRNSGGYFLCAGITPTLPWDQSLHQSRGDSVLAAAGAALRDIVKIHLLIVDHDREKFRVMTEEVARVWETTSPR